MLPRFKTGKKKKSKEKNEEVNADSAFLAVLWNTSENTGKENAIYLSDKASALVSHDSTEIHISYKDWVLTRRDALQ